MCVTARLLTLSVALVALAGCTDGPPGNPGEPDPGAEPTQEGGLALAAGQALLQANTTPAKPVLLEETDALSAQSMPVINMPDGPIYDERHHYLLSDHIPEGVAAWVEANVSWEPPIVGDGNKVYVDVLWDRDAVTRFDGVEYDHAAGVASFSMQAQPAGSGEITVVIGRNGQIDPEAEAEYTFQAALVPLVDHLPGEAAGAVQVPAGGSLVVEPVGNATGPLLVYDGDDRLNASFEVVTERTVVVANITAPTEYVLANPDADSLFHVFVVQGEDAPAPVLRHLPVAVVEGPTEATAGGGASFTFNTDQPPLRLVVYVGQPTSGGTGPYVVAGGRLEVTGPRGEPVLTGSITCVCTGSNWFETAYGDPGLLKGDYTIGFTSTAAENTDVQPVTTQYVR